MNGDPIMPAPPQGDARTTKAYLSAHSASPRVSVVTIAILSFVGAVLGNWIGGSVIAIGIGAGLMVMLFLVMRGLVRKATAKRDLAAAQAAYAVEAALKEKQIEDVRSRGDFDRFGRDG